MQKFPSHDSVVTRRRFEDSIFLRLKQSQEQQESRGERSHVTELNHIPIDTVATVATVATRRVDKHRTCVRGRRMRAKAAVRDLSAVNLEHARSLHGHLPGNYMVPYLQLRQPDLTFSSLRPGCPRFLQASLCPQAPSSASSLAIFLTRIIRSNRTDYDLISFTLALFEILCNCD